MCSLHRDGSEVADEEDPRSCFYATFHNWCNLDWLIENDVCIDDCTDSVLFLLH